MLVRVARCFSLRFASSGQFNVSIVRGRNLFSSVFLTICFGKSTNEALSIFVPIFRMTAFTCGGLSLSIQSLSMNMI